jgi:jagged-like protein
LPLLLVVLHVTLTPVEASGYFELQILSLRNVRGELASGRCCDGIMSGSGQSGECRDQCESFFR